MKQHGFGNTGPVQHLHQYMNQLQDRMYQVSNSPFQFSTQKDYFDNQFAFAGASGASFRASSRRSNIKMSAAGGDGGDSDSPFFNLKTAKLDGTKVDKLGDMVKGKKAILIVNVASV